MPPAPPGPADAASAARTGDAPTADATAPRVRTLAVQLVVHPEVAARAPWRNAVWRALAEATADWEELAGLMFSVDGESSGDAVDTADLAAALQTLAGAREAAADTHEAHTGSDPGTIVLLVAPPAKAPAGEPIPDADLLGYALLARPYLAIRFGEDAEMALGIRHELGHVFGLPHLPGRNLMAESYEQRSHDLDTVALDVLRATRGLDFAAGIPFSGCDLDVLRDAYLLWAERGVGEPVLLRRLAEALRAAGRPDDAGRCETAADVLAR